MNTMMRLASLVCGAILICASPSWAQGVRFGAKGGVNIANQDVTGDNDPPSFDSRIATVAGGFVTLRLASWLDLQAEGLYAMKGARLTVFGIKSAIEIDYLEVPVLGRVRFAHRYYAAGGPSMGFAMRAKTRTTFGTSTQELDVMDQVNRFDFGVAMGGGVEFGRVVIDGRYTLGLTDADKDKTDSTQTKNRAIAVTAGFRF
jgi:Outer membrane protein beta-barrel domain